MGEPKPILLLLSTQALALLVLTVWWVLLPAPVRAARLLQIMQAEQAISVPPTALLAQAPWLLAHRANRVQGATALVCLAGLMGVAEGTARRRQDAQGGYRLAWWTTGLLALACLPGAVAAWLCLPWPIPGLLGSGTLAALGVIVGYGFAYGRPQIV